MSGIKGAPAPKPSQVASPVPGQTALDDFQTADTGIAASAGKAASQIQAQAPAAPAASGSVDPFQTADTGIAPTQAAPGGGALQTVADWAPTAGGILGGAAGLPGAPLSAGASSIAGAAAGGAAGYAIKNYIETNLLGKPATDPNQELLDTATAGLKEGLGAAAGLGVAKGLSSAAATKAGAAVVDGVADIFAKPLAAINGVIETTRQNILKPVTEFIGSKMTAMNTEQAGDAVKKLFGDDIQARYGKFLDSYASLDAVGKAQPIADEIRLGFTNKLKEWAADELGGDNYKMVKKFAEDFNAAGNGKQFQDVIQQLGNQANQAAENKLVGQAAVLREMRDRAETFIEGQTTKLASRISSGNATPQEMGFLQQLMEQRGVVEDSPERYAKTLASDFLKQKDAVRGSYAKFRGFLEDVGEQTRVNASGRGPLQFLKDIQDVPSEKLVERMFDPKNAAALRAMQTETPQVFEQVVKSKFSGLVKQASPDGTLNPQKLVGLIDKLPASSRSLLVNNAELDSLRETLANPQLAGLDALQARAKGSMLGLASQAVQLARASVKGVSGAAARGFAGPGAIPAAARQVVGGAAVSTGTSLATAFGSGGGEGGQ